MKKFTSPLDRTIFILTYVAVVLAGCLTLYTGLRLAGHPIPFFAIVFIVVGWKVVK